MIVSATAYLTIHAFEPHSIYSMRLARTGQLLTHHKDRSILTLLSLDAVIEKERPLITPDMQLGQIVQVVSKSKSIHFAVVDGKRTLLGVLNINALRKIIFRSELYREYDARQLMLQPPVLLYSGDAMTDVMQKFESTDSGTLPVVDDEHRFIGFVSRTRLYGAYRRLMADYSEE